MNRKEFIDALAEKGYTKKDAGQIIDDVFDTVIEAMATGDEVFIYGFGTFAVTTTSAHEVKNIKDGKMMLVPEYKTPRFIAGQPLKRAVREGIYRRA